MFVGKITDNNDTYFEMNICRKIYRKTAKDLAYIFLFKFFITKAPLDVAIFSHFYSHFSFS